MAQQSEIEAAIKAISDVGSFQNLCNEILVREIDLPVNALGSQGGSNKTTQGTPDTFFDGKKYIFVEYTTTENFSTNLFKKINEDIDKCLDSTKTGIQLSDIKDIIYCHTSSNLIPEYKKILKQKCRNKNINLKIYGLNEIARKIKNKYPYLAEEYLDLSIGSGQIFDLLSFRQSYNANKTAASIDTKYILKGNELYDLENEISSNNLIILSGKPGYGKTRLVIEYLTKVKKNYNILCLKNKNNPIGNDFTRYIDNKKENLIFVDDANTFNERLITILEELNTQKNNIKIILTVRKCFLSDLVAVCNEYSNSKVIEVKEFSDEQVKVFLKNEFNINNPKYINQILQICEGNPRIAYYASQIVQEKKTLSSIYNTEQLFKQYYSNYFNKIGLLANDNLLKTAGIISFFIKIDINNLPHSLLNLCNISEAAFLNCCEELVNKEIAGKFQNYYLIEEQCISNYFIFIFLYEKKLVKLSKFVSTYFSSFQKIIIQNINILLNVFFSDDLLNYVKTEIFSLWNQFKNTDDEIPFIKSFGILNPDETCCYVFSSIENLQPIKIELETLKSDFDTSYVYDDLLEIIGNLSTGVDSKILIQLICRYLIKSQNQFYNVLNAIKKYFPIDNTSFENNYQTINTIIDCLMLQKSEEIILLLLLQVSNYYLLTKVTNTTSGRHLSINICPFYISVTEGCKEYRTKMWNILIEEAKNDRYSNIIISFLHKYADGWDDYESLDLISFDTPFFESVIKNLDSKYFYDINQILKCYNRKMEHFGLNEIKMINTDCFTQEILDTFDIDFIENRTKQQKNIQSFYAKNQPFDYSKFIKILNGLFEKKENTRTWELKENLDFFIQSIGSDILHLLKIIDSNSNSIEISVYRTFGYLFNYFNKEEIKNFIKNCSFKNKEEWLYCYFACMPENIISDIDYNEFISFLSSNLDKDIKSCSNRDLSFIKSYLPFDSNVFVTVYDLILKKKQYNNYIFNCYIYPLYLLTEPNTFISLFNENTSFVKNLYLNSIEKNSEIDYEGNFLIFLIENIPDFIDSYIDYLITEINDFNVYISSISERNENILKTANSYSLLDKLFEILNANELCTLHYQKLFVLFKKHQNEAILYIKHFIKNNISNHNKIINIFNTITNFSWDKKEELIIYIIKLNKDIELFSKLPLHSSFRSINSTFEKEGIDEKNFWINLKLKIPQELDYLNHKKYCEERIQEMDKVIEQYQKWDFDMNPKFL